MPRKLFICISVISFVLLFSNCSEDELYGAPDSDFVRKGTQVKYEVFEEGWVGILSVSYRDSVGNNRIDVVPSGWTYGFKTLRDNQPIFLSATASAPTNNVTVRIFINDSLQRETSAPSPGVSFP